MISVIIPAHDEEQTIGRCLGALLDGAKPGELEIVVACNGCTDNTAAVAARAGAPVQVVTTDTASKREAIRLGDGVATAFPRIYLDADVRLDIAGVRALAEALETDGVMVAAPALCVDASRSSPLVRSYYQVYQRLPSVRADVAGRGVYALSRAGRARFGEFPDVTGDDYFVRSIFPPEERRCVSSVVSKVGAPRTLAALIRRKARIVAGNTEVDRMVGAAQDDVRRAGGIREAVRGHPVLVMHVPAYLAVAVAARVLVKLADLRGRPLEWGRDDSRA